MKTIRCVYNDGTFLEFNTNDASNYKNIDRTKLESVVLFENEKEIDSITFDNRYTFAYRVRNVGPLSSPATQKYIILGIVNKNEQILHFIDESNNVEVVDTPDEFAKYGKINLREDEKW